MSEETILEPVAVEPSPVPADAPKEGYSASEAARILAKHRISKRAAETSAPEAAAPADEHEIPSNDGETTPLEEEVRSETQETDQSEKAPVDAPRSWTKEDKEWFQELPRDKQERIAARERSRETDFLRRQNELAEQRKAIEAERPYFEQARQQYETLVQQTAEALNTAMMTEFADIRTPEDEAKLAKEDVLRWAQYQAHKSNLESYQRQAYEAQQRQVQEYQRQFSAWATEQDSKFSDLVPDMKDPAKAKEVHTAGGKVLVDVGFEPTEIDALWNGRSSLSLRDHRVQTLFHDAIKYRTAKSKTVPVKPAPVKTQQPGAAPVRQDGSNALKALEQKLAQTGSERDAIALRTAQLKAGRR